jgi:curved DNA-binding protein CbpA
MFKDYYAILEVSVIATQEEIKAAFKTQALKWHPDRNAGIDTTPHMQEINESYLILKDAETRERYNIEYQRYKQYQRQKQHSQQEQQRHSGTQKQSEQKEKHQERSYDYSEYKVNDDILNKWMDNAKKQAVDLAKQTIEDLKGMVNVGTKAAVKEAGNMIVVQIVLGVIFFVIVALIKACN